MGSIIFTPIPAGEAENAATSIIDIDRITSESEQKRVVSTNLGRQQAKFSIFQVLEELSRNWSAHCGSDCLRGSNPECFGMRVDPGTQICPESNPDEWPNGRIAKLLGSARDCA